MNIERTVSPERINAIANHPDIRAWVNPTPDRDLDLTPAVADSANIALAGAHGVMLFAHLQRGIYEAHTMVLSEGRGAWTLEFAQGCLKWMFCRTPAMELMTRCPKGNIAARALARAIHGVYQFTNPTGWTSDGQPIPADIHALTVQDWIRTAPGLNDRGTWFHERLAAEFALRGRKEPQHPDDNIHDRYVGAAVEMLLGGQLDKAVIFYNRFAAMAGYVPMSIMCRDPVTLDIGNAVVVKAKGKDDFFVPVVRELH
jgi:hypothetical protein